MEMEIQKIKEAIELLKPNGKLYEVRILQGKTIISGYFKGTENLEKALQTVNLRGANVFFTLNEINDACYSRTQHECFRQEKVTTSDGDIVGYDWLLIDIDPQRPSGISSTDAELEEAHELAGKVYKYMKAKNFKEPIVARSGNGFHLLFSIGLRNTDENRALIERCLKALDFMFSNEKVSIDTSVFNPARISKLYGTMAQKGASTKERPHRMSEILSKPRHIEQSSKECLQNLANEYPTEADKPAPRMTKKAMAEEFNIERWLSDHMIRVHEVKRWKDATRYILEECPFDGSHKAPDSTIIHMASGAIAFKCLHNSCAGRSWQDLRLKYEPDAYDEKPSDDDERIENGWKEHKAYNRNRTIIAPKEETPNNPKWETIKHIIHKPREIRVVIPTGTREIDKSIGGGLAKGEISVVSGLRASAKSTWLSQVAINAVDREFNVLFFSGELKDTRFADWILCQAAGKRNVEFSRDFENLAWAKPSVKDKIADWLADHLMLYNNEYGLQFAQIKEDLTKRIEACKSDLVIVDNLAILDLDEYAKKAWGRDIWEAQKEFIKDLKDISIRYNCHICFVAHPRKAVGFLRLDDIAGTGNIGNLVDTALIVHRKNNDFQRLFTQDFGKKALEQFYDATNIIEIAKDRECGTQDRFVPLWYEMGTRRMANYAGEEVKYGWENPI